MSIANLVAPFQGLPWVPFAFALLCALATTLWRVRTNITLDRHPVVRLVLDICLIWIVVTAACLLIVLLKDWPLSGLKLGWYLTIAVAFCVGYALAVTRGGGKKPKIAFIIVAALLFGLAAALVSYRIVEGRWPSDSTSALAPSISFQGQAQPGSQTSPAPSASDALALMALVLTLLTGIAVQYITSSLQTIKQHRDEVDAEIQLFKGHSRLRTALMEERLNRERQRIYLHFSELYIDAASSVPPTEYNIERDRLSNVRATFADFDMPRNADARAPAELQQVFAGIRKLSFGEHREHRLLLERHHVDYIRRTARRVLGSKKLHPIDRTAFARFVDEFEVSLENDRLHF